MEEDTSSGEGRVGAFTAWAVAGPGQGPPTNPSTRSTATITTVTAVHAGAASGRRRPSHGGHGWAS
eukprot:284386-Heterocapsa_arctica.AAC.1